MGEAEVEEETNLSNVAETIIYNVIAFFYRQLFPTEQTSSRKVV